MPAPLRKIYRSLDLDRAQEQARAALRMAFAACGSQPAFVEALNASLRAAGRTPISRQAVSWWLSEGTFVDPAFWPHIEAITDLAVTRRHLAPQKYGPYAESCLCRHLAA